MAARNYFTHTRGDTVPRCFLLGAGFSKPCGLPLASELTKQVFGYAYPPDCTFRPDIRKHWLNFLRHLYPQSNFDEHWPDFENLITVIDEWAIYQGEYEGRDRTAEPLSPPHFKDVLLQNLALLLCEKSTQVPPGAIDYVKTFIQTIDRSSDAVISFNWDAVIEIACDQLGIQVSYTNRPSGGLWMAKPHGSVTLSEMRRNEFYEASKCGNVRDVRVDWEHEGVVVIRAVHPSDAANRIVYPFKNTVLVEPTARKVYRSRWIQLQWRNAYEMLRCSDEISVIGFSLQPTDYRPRILLQAATLDRVPQPSIQIVDPNASTLAERFRAVRNAKVTSIAMAWEDWIGG